MTIKNGDLPAMALYDMPLDARSAAKWLDGSLCGLTKREHFAALAMQGLLAKHGDDDYQPEQISDYAVAHADALLKKLERTK